MADAAVDPICDAKNLGYAPSGFQARFINTDGDDASPSGKRKGDRKPAIACANIRNNVACTDLDEAGKWPDIAADIEINGAVQIDVSVSAAGEMRNGTNGLSLCFIDVAMLDHPGSADRRC